MAILQFKVQSNYDEVVRLRQEIESLERTLRNFGPGTAEDTIRRLEAQLARTRAQFTALADEAIRAGAGIERGLNASVERLRGKGDLNLKVNADTRSFSKGLAKVDSDFQDVMRNLDTYSNKLRGFFNSVSSVAGFTLPLMGVLDFLGRVKETRTYFQDIESTMTVLLGSEQKSLEFCEQLEAAAYWNMFEYADLVGASKQMIAYGVETDKIIPKINQLSEVATATKASLGEMVDIYDRAKAIGYIDSRALQTWAARGLVVKDVLKEMGETATGSKVTFEQLNKVLDHVTGEGGMFHDVMKSQMNNISAEIGQLEDNMSLMFNDIGKELQEPLIKIVKAAGWVVDNWQKVATTLGIVGATMASFKFGDRLHTKAFLSDLDEAKKKLAELKDTGAGKLDVDIQEGLDKGIISKKEATDYQGVRDEIQKIAEEKAKAAEAAGKEAAEYTELGKMYQKDLEVAKERKQKADEMVESMQKQLELQEQGQGDDDNIVTQLDLEAAMREQAAAQTAVETLEEQANSAAKLADASATQQETLAQQANTASTQVSTAAKGANTGATRANAVAAGANTAATTRNTLATRLGAMMDRTAAAAKTMFRNAVNSVTAAWKALGIAVKSNPIGMVLSMLTTAIGLFMAFRKESEDTSAEVERFGESAVKAVGNVETLYAVISSVSKKSKVYRDAVSELEKACKEHGVALKYEKDQIADEKQKYDELISVKERLITLIQEEGRQKIIANNIDSMQKGFQETTDEFQSSLADHIIGGNDEEKVREHAELLTKIITDSMMSEEGRALEQVWRDAQAKLEKTRRESSHMNSQEEQRAWADMMAAKNAMLDYYEKSAKISARNLGIEELNFNPKAEADILKQAEALRTHTEQVNEFSKAMQRSQAVTEAGKDKEKPDFSSMDTSDLLKKLHETSLKVEELNKSTVKVKVDGSEVKNAAKDAEEASGKVDELDGKTAAPDADTSGIRDLKDWTDTAKSVLDEVSATVAAPSADTSQTEALTDSALDSAAALTMVGNVKVAPKMDLSFFERGYEFIRKAVANLGIDLPALNAQSAKPGSKTSPEQKEAQADLKAIKAAFSKRLKEANTKNKLSQMKKDVSAALADATFGSAEYKYLESLEEQIKKKDPDSKKGKGKDAAQLAYERAKAEKEEQKRLAELREKAAQDARDMEIAAMDDGTEKEIAEIRNNAKKKRDALLKERQQEADKLRDFDQKQWMGLSDKNKAYKWQQTVSDEEYRQRAAEAMGYSGKLAEIAYNESEEIAKTYAKEMSSMRDHLKEYGTFEQRKLAITEEYALKIAAAATDGERLTLQSEQKKALDNVEAEAITAKIDWYSVFDNVGIVMKGQLEPLFRQLQDYVRTDAFRSSGAENQKAVIEAMQNLRRQLGTGNTSWRDLAASLTDYQHALNELRLATEEDTRVTGEMAALMDAENTARLAFENANRNLANGTGTIEEVNAARQAYEQTQQAVRDFGAKVSASAGAVSEAKKNVSSAGALLSQSATSVTQPVSEVTTLLQSSGIPQLGELFAAFDKLRGGIDGLKALESLKKGTKDVTEGVQSLKEGADGLKEGAEDVVKEGGDALIDGLDKAGLITQVISAVLSIMDMLKDGVGTLISNVIDTVLNAISGILDNLLSGQFARQIGESLVKGVGGIFKAVTTMGGLFDWWGGGESDPELEKDVERLSLTNEALRRAIEDLTDEMRDASIGDARKMYEETQAKYAELAANTQEMMSREAAAYNNGFLGIGGSKSANSKIDSEMTSANWAEVSRIAGRSVQSAADFWKLTSEQMAKVKKDSPALFAKIKQFADEGYKDASQYMEEYVGYYEELEQLRDAYYESLTSISLDSVKDQFKSLLGDMESTAEDFADNFEQMMQEAVINAFVNEVFEKQLSGWYDSFVAAMESENGLSAAEQAQLQREWDDMAQEAIRQRDELAKAMGWDTSSTQQSSSRSVSGMSQDTGDAIEGRLTAIQIATESIRTAEQAGALSLAQMTQETLGLMSRSNELTQHYENMEHQIAKCYLELTAISENTGAIVQPINDMRGYLNEMNKKL